MLYINGGRILVGPNTNNGTCIKEYASTQDLNILGIAAFEILCNSNPCPEQKPHTSSYKGKICKRKFRIISDYLDKKVDCKGVQNRRDGQTLFLCDDLNKMLERVGKKILE